MGGLYTLAVWFVVPGREDEFVAAWAELAERTLAEFPAARGTLLRDREQPNRFVSFGPWESLEQIAAWRASSAFRDVVGRIRALLDDFSPGTYDVELDTAQPDTS